MHKLNNNYKIGNTLAEMLLKGFKHTKDIPPTPPACKERHKETRNVSNETFQTLSQRDRIHIYSRPVAL